MNLKSRPAKLITAFLASIYAIATILSHDWAQQFVISVQKDPAWTWSALVGTVLVLFSLAIFFVRRWKRYTSPGRTRVLLSSWIMTAILIGFAQWLLVSVHTEAIHYLQYGLLTVLVFTFFRRIHVTFIIVIIVGMIDEAYQYWSLYTNWPVYYDINDVLLNTLAGGLTLLFLLSTMPDAFIDDTKRDSWLVRNIDLLVLAAVSLLLVSGVATEMIALYRIPHSASDEALLIMNRSAPSTRFWYHAWWSGKYYHQMSLVNGMIALVLIAQYYRFSLPLLLRKNENP